MKDYILITPCRNEEKNLPNLLLSIISQTKKPILWVIIDDNSIDMTGDIIKGLENKYPWIKGIYNKKLNIYMGSHYAITCNIGFNYAMEYCKKKNINYEFIGLVDSDNIPETTYFEFLLEKFLKFSRLGIASGNSAVCDINSILLNLKITNNKINVLSPEFWALFGTNQMKILKAWDDMPMGSARIWRKQCFEETNGYLPVCSPDSVSNVKAKVKGWETKRFFDAKVIERKASVKQGLWKGYFERGKTNYFLGHSFFYALFRSIKFSLQLHFYLGIAYFYGYLKSFIFRKQKIDDPEVINYYKNRRLIELKQKYIESIRNKI